MRVAKMCLDERLQRGERGPLCELRAVHADSLEVGVHEAGVGTELFGTAWRRRGLQYLAVVVAVVVVASRKSLGERERSTKGHSRQELAASSIAIDTASLPPS